MEPREPPRIDLATLDDAALDALCRSLPKADLHCHLDGSLRPETVRDLARERDVRAVAEETGLTLPASDASARALRELLFPSEGARDLVDYLKVFATTVAVLQMPAALERAAYELASDAAEENVRYLEVRFAPMLHINRLLDGIDVLRAVDRGLERAERERAGRLRTGIIVCALRNFDASLSAFYRGFAKHHRYASDKELAPLVSLETARLAVAAREEGMTRVLAFDLAGPEDGYPPSHHQEAFRHVIDRGLSITVHAGEAFGPKSIREAVAYLGARRIGHGTRILEEGEALLGYFVDHRIPVEVCLTSNVETRAVASLRDHPFPRLLEARVRTALCTDNRLFSKTTASGELAKAIRAFGLDAEQVRRVVLYGFKSAFLHYAERREILLQAKGELREKGLGWGVYD